MHVVHKDGRWQAEAGKVSGVKKLTKAQVVAAAVLACHNLHKGGVVNVELYIHTKNGEIKERRTYGDDPRGTKG